MSAIPRSATARLRKTFQYPTDDSSFSDSPEILDEDEQESLIQTLAEQNEARNRQFRLIMLALPALSTLPYLLGARLVLLPAASPLPTLLSLSSLASTAWLLYRQDPTETGVPRLDAWAAAARHRPATDGDDNDNDNDEDDDDDDPSTPLSPSARRRHRERRRRRHSSFSLPAGPGGAQLQQRSPLETHLPLLNAALCAVLLLMGLAIARGGGSGGRDDDAARLGRAVLACLPAAVYAVVVAAKLVMASVDPEAELNALRYEAKGA